MQYSLDPNVAARLRTPPSRGGKSMSIAALVRMHFDDILEARSKPPRDRKTWEEIGRDLRPTDPLKGGSVGRAFARIVDENRKSPKRESSLGKAGITDDRGAHDELSNGLRNPFAHAVDPIRGHAREDRHNA